MTADAQTLGVIKLGDIAPDFEAETTKGKIRFHEWLGDAWGILFSHPRDFTPVCTTELGEVARLRSEFESRGVRVIGLSVDDVESHHTWEADIADIAGAEMWFPMIADPDRTVSSLYGMVHPNELDSATVRSVFIIDPAKRVRLMITYPASVGRNFAEIVRVIDALQRTSRYPVVTPANWTPGQRVILATSVPTDQARAAVGHDAEEIRPYLRLVADPGTN
ncbi:Peroxidase [Acidimicrobium ferrooxidans DSM 10331]|uniref:Peroxidase n=1 Tax=Acidimicrobium ferrooxidans (strain DSM 10331 / JCM 15462 / NBRC 103882 / ICP) TaxID=525909 RepID=C7LYJ6_ACIFD|nr:peroxiredoxin [Acidimicrobium ferrooxidans]ACU53804.1 Peroxidase [Acidimicrobium ferrooxidans DSM 10331]